MEPLFELFKNNLKKSKNWEKLEKFNKKLNFLKKKLEIFIYYIPYIRLLYSLINWIKKIWKTPVYFVLDILINGALLYYIILGYEGIPQAIEAVTRLGLLLFVITRYVRMMWYGIKESKKN